MPSNRATWACLALLTVVSPSQGDVVITEGTNIAVDVSRTDERLAIDLLGSIWIVPPSGGAAEAVTDVLLPARRPRWSPDSGRILFQTESTQGAHLWLHDLARGESARLGDGHYADQQGAWHPDGERIVFASDRRDSGLDIWEMDVPTGLAWRITTRPGDETAPAWSADGRHLAFIGQLQDQWELVVRRFGEPESTLVVSGEPLSSPSWRPDGSLITYLRQFEGSWSLHMVILSEPPIERLVASGEDLFLSPVSWRDRHSFVYAADGVIKTRGFEDRRATPVTFAASIAKPDARPARAGVERELPLRHPPSHKLVIRGARLFDGRATGYRVGQDVVVDGPRIAAVEARRDRDDAVVLDLGDVTILPGFVDMYVSLPAVSTERSGAALLAYGVTTVVADEIPRGFEVGMWDGEERPGPMVLRAADASVLPLDDPSQLMFVTVAAGSASGALQRSTVREWQAQGLPVLVESWKVGLGLGADLLLGADTLPTSPLGHRYQDIQVAVGGGPITLVSGLADAGTPGLAQLFDSRQARHLRQERTAVRRYASLPSLSSRHSSVVLGSKPSGLPPGLSLHAELRALAAAGLDGHQVLKAAGANAARALGLGDEIGQITAGARADLVLVSGDPLRDVADALKVVAVVRNGRFFSLVSLLERSGDGSGVE